MEIKYKNLGKVLTKNQQRKVIGGTGEDGCTSGPNTYSCTVEWSNGSTTTEDSGGNSCLCAKQNYIVAHPSTTSVTCCSGV